MNIDNLNEKFFDEYKDFLLLNNLDLAKRVWNKNSKLISSQKKSSSSSVEAYNFGIFSLNLINAELENNIKNSNENEKISMYSSIICDWKPDYSFDAIYIPENWNIQIFDFKQWKQWLDFNEIELFKNYFIDHIENSKRTDPNNPILKELLDNLDKKITSENIECDIYIIREKEIVDYSIFENQLNELRWKTKKAKIWSINIIDWKKINNLIKNNLISLSDYNNSFYNLNFETFTTLNDGSNIITTSLYELLKFYLETKKLNYDVFKLNVRYNKWDKNIIRWKMIDTIESTPDKFFRYHNWINLTYNNIEKQNNNLKIQYPQIINWCQTISLLEDKFLRFLKVYLNIWNDKDYNNEISLEEVIKNIEKLKKAKILIKSHNNKLLDWEVDRIAEYSNNQNPIDKQNLRSNDLIQIILENFISKIWYKYIRKEWEKKEWSFIEIDTLFQLIHACIFEMPNWSKNDKNRIFTLDDSKYSYLNILEKVTLDEIDFIINLYFNYKKFKKEEENKLNRISDYYDHHIILSLFYIFSKWWILKENINEDFINIYELLNKKILYDKKAPWFKMHLLQRQWGKIWIEFKNVIHYSYELNILVNFWGNEYNITELENYKIDRINEKIKNPDSKLWNITSVIKKLVNNNYWILKNDLINILKDFYRTLWRDNVDRLKFDTDVEIALNKNFKVENEKIYLK